MIYICLKNNACSINEKQIVTVKRLTPKLLYLLLMENNKVLSLQFCWFSDFHGMERGEKKTQNDITNGSGSVPCLVPGV